VPTLAGDEKAAREEGDMAKIIIGTDPHKASSTIEVVDRREKALAKGRYTTDNAGYRQMTALARQWPDRTWAVEGANGAGRPPAQRLLADGETVVDVPAKLAARIRVLDTGQGRKTDATDAHSIAIAALRAKELRVLDADEDLTVLRLLVDRRDQLSRARVQAMNRLHRLLTELVGGGAPRKLTVLQAKAILADLRPRRPAARTRRRLAADLVAELVVLDRKLKEVDAGLREMVKARGSGLMGLFGIGPAGAARILADVGDVARFADRNRFAAWNGTAPLDASSGQQIRHRLSRAGDRRVNHVLYIAAIVQIRHDTPGRAYYRRKLAEGKTPMEALRCLRRRISDAVYRQLTADAPPAKPQAAAGAEPEAAAQAGPGGQTGATADPSGAAGPTPTAGSSEQPHTGPASSVAGPGRARPPRPAAGRPARGRVRAAPADPAAADDPAGR
jgi:transposase